MIRTKYDNLYVLPATINLAGIEYELENKGTAENSFRKGDQLKKCIEDVREEFDYIIIDCPPSLSKIATNALAASNSVIIPVQGFEVVEDIRSFFKEKVYNTIIPRLVKLTEAPSHGEPIIVYDPKSRGSEAYLNLAKEVIERNGNEQQQS